MSEHRVSVHVSRPLDVKNADLIIEIASDSAELGELRMPRGSIDWAPRNHIYAYQLPWEQFDSVMQKRGDHR